MSNGDQSVYVMANCPACGTQNRLTVSAGSDDQPVSCSHCGVQLGQVRDLAAATELSVAVGEPVGPVSGETVETSQ